MKLQSSPRLAHSRSVPPADTIVRLEALLGPRFDYWTHAEDLDGLLYWAALFIDALEFRAMGKGTSAEDSYVGALAEGAEWLLALDTVDLPGYRVGYEHEIENPLSLGDLLGHVGNATPPLLEQVRKQDAARHWVNGWSLLRDEPVSVPIEFVRQICGPNGKASGNTLEEALLHSILEVFERRAHITVLRNRMVVPTIDPATVTDPVIRERMQWLEARGVRMVIKDLSFGGVLPCLGVWFEEPAVPAELQFRNFFKVGCSFDANEALLRTITEYTQGRRSWEFTGAFPERAEEILKPDFRQLPSQPDDCDNFLSCFMFGMIPYRNCAFLAEGDVVPFVSAPPFPDLLDDLNAAFDVCRTLGKEVIAVDYTDPEHGFPVAQVIVPGYSDVLPYHPAGSDVLFRTWGRPDVVASYSG